MGKWNIEIFLFRAVIKRRGSRCSNLVSFYNQTIETSQNRGGCFLGKQRRNNRRAPAISKSNSLVRFISPSVFLCGPDTLRNFSSLLQTRQRGLLTSLRTESIWISSQSRFYRQHTCRLQAGPLHIFFQNAAFLI